MASRLEPLINLDSNIVLEFIVPLLIFANIVAVEDQYFDFKNSIMFWRIQTVTALLIWWRAFMFLKSVDTFSWLVRMIIEVIVYMGPFLVVFFIGVLAFADAFLSQKQILIIEGKSEPYEPDDPNNIVSKYLGEYFQQLRVSY
jgi:hypothetical protein